ncbi:unnamed protein product [[Candida] boidinii]|uniref:Unnamed protein product n=1 Tax=Candida boidinii TaxID=5477 RepID=A0A9W6SVA2_CANBO|nr:unnamed protein product [[Candida] boidinii]
MLRTTLQQKAGLLKCKALAAMCFERKISAVSPSQLDETRYHIDKENNFLVIHKSPLNEFKDKNGNFDLEYLINSKDLKLFDEKLLACYRMLIRLKKFSHDKKYFRLFFLKYTKMRFRENYNLRRKIILNCFHKNNIKNKNSNGDVDSSGTVMTFQELTEKEILNRLINTIHFVNNASLYTGSNINENKEAIIIRSILEYENSKLKSRMLKQFDLFNIDTFYNSYITSRNLKTDDIALRMLDDSSYRYFKRIEKDLNSHHLPVKSNATAVSTIIQYERNLILFNETSKLIL